MTRFALTLAATSVLAAPAPWLLEQALGARVEQALGRCEGEPHRGDCGSVGEVQLDAGGLRLRELDLQRKGLRATMRSAEVRPSWGGLDVHLTDLRVERAPAAPPPQPSESARSERSATGDSSVHLPTHGLAVRVRTTGTTAMTVRGVTALLDAPALDIDAQGVPRASFGLTLQHARGTVRSHGRLRARPGDSLQAWTLGGTVSIAQGPPLALRATVRPSAAQAELSHESGGWLGVTVDPTDLAADLDAHDFPLHALGRLSHLSTRGMRANGEAATVDGHLEVRSQPALAVHADAWTVRDLELFHEQLARDPLTLGTLVIDGDATLRDTTHFDAEFTLAHDGLSMALSTSVRPQRASLRVDVPDTPCQALFSGLPAGFADALRGTRARGRISGRLEVEVDLDAAAERQRRLDEDPQAELPPPGHLKAEFPFRERCTVTAEPAAIDFAALRGPYRHRFVDAHGTARSQMLAPGATEYVSLSRIPLVAGAFVALEDARYFHHDGLDLEQIGNALWHNLGHGRVERGASTITQQAARNLFLGLDRTAARKLQEAFIATRLDTIVGKRRLLEVYLNIIELAPGVHGVESAAQFYFGRSADRLSPAQATHLAMLAPAPRTYSERFVSGDVDASWRAELRAQIRRLARHKVITKEQMYGALRAKLGLVDRRPG